MRFIQLTQNRCAIVDDADYERLNKFKWYAHKNGNTFYAIRKGTKDESGKQEMIYMHRFLLGLNPNDPRQGDHRNHNGLDNRQGNLRIVSNRQNHQNSIPQINCSSKYKGVSWNKSCHKWLARIRIKGKLAYLGRFDNEIEAAKAYDNAAREHFGEYAEINHNY